MNKRNFTLTVLGAAVFIMSSAFIAQGQNVRTYVAVSNGNDANAAGGCLITTPCRTFQAAFNVTNAGGQVVALETGGYSGVSVNKSITIMGAPGQTAFIFVGASAVGVAVTGVSHSDIVSLRNIYIDGLNNASTTGLSHTGPARLVVENCTFRNLTTGVSASGTNNSTLPARMDLIEPAIYGNGTGVLATGSGMNNPGNAQVFSTTIVRIRGGNITFNTTGLNQVNPGSGLCNIGLYAPNQAITNIIGNTTQLACSGAGCNTNPCTFSYSSGLVGP